MNTGLPGKVVIITGASKGIGRAIASAFATEGARLAICARDDHALKLAADEIQSQTHADVIAIKANTTRLNDIRRFVDAAMKKFNHIDILVNNAGGVHIGGISDTTDEDWEYQIQLKLLGYIRMAREVIKHMRPNGGGKIINIVGTGGREPAPLFLVPGIVNAGLLNFTKSLSLELAADHISVNSVNPSITETPLTDEMFKKLAAILQKTPEELRQASEHASPRGRLGSPEAVADAVLFLASAQADNINGSSINVDAGSSSGVW